MKATSKRSRFASRRIVGPQRTIEDAVRDHLNSKPVTLWANWDLTRPDSFEKAVSWLAAEVKDVQELLNDPDA